MMFTGVISPGAKVTLVRWDDARKSTERGTGWQGAGFEDSGQDKVAPFETALSSKVHPSTWTTAATKTCPEPTVVARIAMSSQCDDAG